VIAESDGRRVDGPDCGCDMSELCTFVYTVLVVIRSLSVEMPFTGRFWLHNATEQNNVTAQMSKTTTS